MGDWDFLYEMSERGCSTEEIADAAGSGAAPWEWGYISREWIESELDDEPEDEANSIEPSEPYQKTDGFPFSILDQTQIFRDLVDWSRPSVPMYGYSDLLATDVVGLSLAEMRCAVVQSPSVPDVRNRRSEGFCPQATKDLSWLQTSARCARPAHRRVAQD